MLTLVSNSEIQNSKFSIDISVIIPTYNRIKMLEEALASVFAQEFDGTIEIIVIDDNSQDGTSEMVINNYYPSVRLISLKQNVGAYVTRNRGLIEVQGRYVAFLDSDDLWEPNYLMSQISALEGKEKSFSVSAVSIMNTVNQEKGISYQKPEIGRFISPIHQLLVTTNFIGSPSSVVFPCHLFEEIGLFDETFRVGADREFYLRCLLFGYEPIWTEKPLAIVRKHDQGQLTNLSANKINLRTQSRIASLQKHHSVLNEHFQEIPISRIYAEIYSAAARSSFQGKYFLNWLIFHIKVGKYTSMGYVVINILRDLMRPTKKNLSPSLLRLLKKKFLSNSLST